MLSHRKSCLIFHVENVCIFSASSVFGWKPLLCPYEIKNRGGCRCRDAVSLTWLYLTVVQSLADAGELTRRHREKAWPVPVLFQFRNPFLMRQQAPITSTIATVRNVIRVTPNNWGPSIRGLTITWILAVWSLLFYFAPLNVDGYEPEDRFWRLAH